jgi:hypothetical protein
MRLQKLHTDLHPFSSAAACCKIAATYRGTSQTVIIPVNRDMMPRSLAGYYHSFRELAAFTFMAEE